MKRLIIIGASGHGKVIADIAKHIYDEIVFLDDDPGINNCYGCPVVGTVDKALSIDGDLFIAIGNADIRKRLMERFSAKVFPVLLHPNAIIADEVEIGSGSVVMAGVVINPGVSIGKGCIINTSSSVDHDCIIGDYSHVSVGAHLAGTVSVGNDVLIGAGATVINNVSICDGCMIGAGAVVIKDICMRGTYVGVPAGMKK